MNNHDLSGKRVLVLGAESEIGREVASALAGVGARVAVVASTAGADAAFAVQRLARRLAGGGGSLPAQAIDATNEMAVRVMVRQVAKQMGGLDAVVFAADLGEQTAAVGALALRFGVREMKRTGGGRFVTVGGEPGEVPPGVELVRVDPAGAEVAAEVVRAVAGRLP